MTDTQPPVLYELKVTASGTVRDAEGNIISDNQQIESTVTLTEQQLREHFERSDS